MSTLDDSALVLRCWDFSETSQTVSLLSREHGIMRGLAKGARRPQGSFSGGFDPLTRGHVVASVRPGRDLATLTEWHLEGVWWKARNQLAVNRPAIYMVDLVGRMITDADPHPVVFSALCEALDRMEAGHDPAWPLLRFQWSLLSETGYRPMLEVDGDDEVVAFSSSLGGVLPDTGGQDHVRVRRETVQLLRMVDEVEQPLQPVSPECLERACRLLGHYLRDLIGSESAAMRWMWNSARETAC